jgi:hypothetical protein
LPGVSVRTISELSVLDLAPGANPIRLTIYSKNAIESFNNVKCRYHEIMEVSELNDWKFNLAWFWPVEHY